MDQSAALADLLRREQVALLAEWRQKVRELPSARALSVPMLNDHVPKLLDALVDALRHPGWSLPEQPGASAASVEHGIQRARNGYDIGEVVTEYGMLRGCIHTLAEIHGLPVRDDQLQILNGVLDRAIAVAVRAFVVQCELDEKKRRDEHLSFIAHDLRTPLNAVVLATSVLERNGESEDERRRMIDVLRRNVRQLATLVESVLQDNHDAIVEGRGRPQQRMLQLWPLVEELIANLQPHTDGRAVRLVNRIPDDLMVHADAAMLRRVLKNLVGHALAQPRVGHVWIGVQPPRGADADTDIDTDIKMICEVRSDGVGLSAAQLRELLESPPDLLAGNGPERLSLSIARTLVEAHGSALRTDSDGSTFSFALPARLQAPG